VLERECAQISQSSFRFSFSVFTGALILVMPAERVSEPEDRVAGLGLGLSVMMTGFPRDPPSVMTKGCSRVPRFGGAR